MSDARSAQPFGRCRGLVGLALALALLLAPLTLAAQSMAGGAREFVATFSERAIATLRTGAADRARRTDALAALLRQGFELDTIAQLALGRYWRTAAPAQRDEYRRLFEAYIITVYGQRLDGYRGQSIRVTGSQPVGNDVMVESWVEGGGSPVRLDWRLRRVGDGWRVVDLVVEGVSMVVTQRNEFAAVLERGNGDVGVLIGHLRARLDAARGQTS